jgi:hypothetical protein
MEANVERLRYVAPFVRRKGNKQMQQEIPWPVDVRSTTRVRVLTTIAVVAMLLPLALVLAACGPGSGHDGEVVPIDPKDTTKPSALIQYENPDNLSDWLNVSSEMPFPITQGEHKINFYFEAYDPNGIKSLRVVFSYDQFWTKCLTSAGWGYSDRPTLPVSPTPPAAIDLAATPVDGKVPTTLGTHFTLAQPTCKDQTGYLGRPIDFPITVSIFATNQADAGWIDTTTSTTLTLTAT